MMTTDTMLGSKVAQTEAMLDLLAHVFGTSTTVVARLLIREDILSFGEFVVEVELRAKE